MKIEFDTEEVTLEEAAMIVKILSRCHTMIIINPHNKEEYFLNDVYPVDYDDIEHQNVWVTKNEGNLLGLEIDL